MAATWLSGAFDIASRSLTQQTDDLQRLKNAPEDRVEGVCFGISPRAHG